MMMKCNDTLILSANDLIWGYKHYLVEDLDLKSFSHSAQSRYDGFKNIIFVDRRFNRKGEIHILKGTAIFEDIQIYTNEKRDIN